jgi:hypothetical protein
MMPIDACQQNTHFPLGSSTMVGRELAKLTAGPSTAILAAG